MHSHIENISECHGFTQLSLLILHTYVAAIYILHLFISVHCKKRRGLDPKFTPFINTKWVRPHTLDKLRDKR